MSINQPVTIGEKMQPTSHRTDIFSTGVCRGEDGRRAVRSLPPDSDAAAELPVGIGSPPKASTVAGQRPVACRHDGD